MASERIVSELESALYGLECLHLHSFDIREKQAIIGARRAMESAAHHLHACHASTQALPSSQATATPDDCPACPHGNKSAAGAPVCADCMPELARAIQLSTARHIGAEDQS